MDPFVSMTAGESFQLDREGDQSSSSQCANGTVSTACMISHKTCIMLHAECFGLYLITSHVHTASIIVRKRILLRGLRRMHAQSALFSRA